MTETGLPQELEEQAALYALGTLTPDDRRAFEVRLQGESLPLRHENARFEAVANELAWTVTPVVPRPSLRERLLAHLEGHTDVRLDPVKGLTFVKASEAAWQEMAPGISAKVLFSDPASRRVTALVRFAPGASYAPHRHTEAEELYVLEGGCFCGGRELTVGDYHRAEAGTEHHDTSSDDGCLLMVISSPQNEMLP